MKIFLCIILRLNGVHLIKSTTKLYVFMLIIGKISEGNQIYFNMIALKFVKIGKQENLFQNTLKDVQINLLVHIVMVGKNKSITHCFIKLKYAKKHIKYYKMILIFNQNRMNYVLEGLNVPTSIL
jgi:hypothetical protein